MTGTSKAKSPTTVGLDPAVVERLDAAARGLGRSRADVMRIALDEWLERHHAADPTKGGDDDAPVVVVRGRRTHR